MLGNYWTNCLDLGTNFGQVNFLAEYEHYVGSNRSFNSLDSSVFL